MKRFGSIFPFTEHGASDLKIGRLVANLDFVRALLRYGDFDEFVFSNPSTASLRTFGAAAGTWQGVAERGRAIRFVPLAELPALLARETFHVFHLGGWGYFMPGLHALRARYASNAWPMTGLIHSLNGREMLDHAVRVATAELAPYDAIVCTSGDGETALRTLLDLGARVGGRAYAGRFARLPLGLDDDLVDAAGDPSAVRQRLRIDAGADILLCLGRVTPSQKMDVAPLLRAFALDVLPRLQRPACLVLAGGASETDVKLVREMASAHGIADAVRLYPNFPDAAKPDLLASASLAVQLVDNPQETFGLSVLEAQAFAVPVVASRFSGYKELVEHERDGLLVDTFGTPAHPIDELADLFEGRVEQLLSAQSTVVDLVQAGDAMVRLLNDPPLRAAMGARARDKMRREYRYSVVIRRYEALWDELQGEARRAGRVAAAASPFQEPPRRIFAHYPSHRLDEATLVQARPGVPGDRPYAEVAVWVNAEQVDGVLGRARTPVAIGDLRRALPASGDAVWPIVAWLLKYGLLRFVSPAPTDAL